MTVSTQGWLSESPVRWALLPAKAAFQERREPNLPGDVHLTPSQIHGVLPQTEYMQRTGNAVVLNIQGQDSMKHVEPDDFIIHLRSFQGGIERSTYRGKVSTAYTVLEPSGLVVADYFRWLLKSDGYIQELRTTTNQLRDGQSIKFRDFTKIPLPVPPQSEQRAIADYLDRETARIDTLIDEQQRLIDMLKERRLLIVAHAIPKDGPKGRMKWDTRMVAGGTPDTNVDEYWLDGDDENGIPFVAIGDMSRRRSVTCTVKRLSESAMTSRTMPTGQPGTLLLAMYASVGEVALLEIEATWNQAILGITPDPTKLDASFLRYALLQMRSDLLRDVRSNTQANLNASQVGDLWVPMPSLDEQRRIAAHLDNQMEKIDTTLAETERFVELSRERRSALITAAVTGQINVREVA